MFDLSGKKAVVTAAAQGIGRAVAEAFVAAGAEVFACDINESALADVDGAEAVGFDATRQDHIERLAARTGAIDILFNGVGWVHHGTILECAEEDWARAFKLNVDSMYHTIRAYLPGMAEKGGGSIINMSSVASSVIAVPNRFAYGATKGAVIGLTKSVAADFVAQRVRCNAICPGTVDTPSLRERVAAQGDFETVMAAFVARQPVGRLGRAEEVAALALYLASDEAAFTTGQVHIIDGGWSNE
jgi:2-keto-3-deoxy-L-fuconate dehydrogenase